MDFETIARLRKYLTIKDSNPGTIKIKFDQAIILDPDAMKLAQSKPAMPSAVKDTSLNLIARTLIIRYDENQVAPHLLEELVTAESDERASEVVRELHSALYQ